MGTTVSAEVAALHKAATDGDLDTMKKLVKGCPDRRTLLNTPNGSGETPLLLVAGSRKADIGTLRRDKIIEMLLNFGATVSASDSRRGWTALHYAASIGACDTIKLLLERGCSPYTRDKSGNLYQQIIVQGHAPVRRSSSSEELAQVETKKVVDHRLKLAKAHLVEAWPYFTSSLSPRKWSLLHHVEIVETDRAKVHVVIHFPNQEKYDEAVEGSNFVQFVYVKEKPWNQTPVLGFFQRVQVGELLKDIEEPKTPLPSYITAICRVKLVFDLSQLPPLHSFRCLLVCGEMSTTPEHILAASDIFHTDVERNVELEQPQSFLSSKQLYEEQGESSDDDSDDSDGYSDEVQSTCKESHPTGQAQSHPTGDDKTGEEDDEEDEDEAGYETDEDDEDDMESGLSEEAIREEVLELDMQFQVGAPWEITPLPNERISFMRDTLIKKRALALSQDRSIWQSRWTELVNPPPADFVVDTKLVSEHAKLALEKDPGLAKARLELVPSKISEHSFWWAYFWHIELIKLQVTDLLHVHPLPQELLDCENHQQPKQDEQLGKENGKEKGKPTFFLPIHLTAESQLAVLREHTRDKLRRLDGVGDSLKITENTARSPRRVHFDNQQ